MIMGGEKPHQDNEIGLGSQQEEMMNQMVSSGEQGRMKTAIGRKKRANAGRSTQTVRRSARVNTGDQPLSTKERVANRAKVRALEMGSASAGRTRPEKEHREKGPRARGSVQVKANFEDITDEEIVATADACGFDMGGVTTRETVGKIRELAGNHDE